MLLSSYIMPLKSGGGTEPQELINKMEGGVGVSVDLNQAETKVKVALDLTGSAAGKALRVNSTNDGVEWGVVDDAVTEDSENLITSGAVFDAISASEEVLIAEYNTTTFSNIIAAVNAGKLVMLKDTGARYGTLYAPVVLANSGLIAFGITQNELNYYYTLSSSDAWNRGSWEVERTSNKKTAISGNESSNTYYPTTKAVADALANKQDTLDSEGANANVIAPLYVDTGELRLDTGNGLYKVDDVLEVKPGKGIVVNASGVKCEGVTYNNDTTEQTNPLKFVKCTQAQYNVSAKDADTFYIIVN